MSSQFAVVVTTINYPTKAVVEIQEGCEQRGGKFYVIGDAKSPQDFSLPGANYYNLGSQLTTGFNFAKSCPTGHYARKNIGYLAAIRAGAEIIVETDDDNIPREEFWRKRERLVTASVAREQGWNNVYRYFTQSLIWPRGLPLDHVQVANVVDLGPASLVNCPIQQGLADLNPDVDAIYRLILTLPLSFNERGPVALDKGVWCPFNSQNTTFWRDAFPLLYLPYYCSFRMTDIWRSFVAQRILWTNNWSLMFHNATVYQERNQHNLMADFHDEIPGYLHNNRIKQTLEDLNLRSGREHIADNMRTCYSALISLGLIGEGESALLDLFLNDLVNSGW